jgi:hypothetical protein
MNSLARLSPAPDWDLHTLLNNHIVAYNRRQFNIGETLRRAKQHPNQRNNKNNSLTSTNSLLTHFFQLPKTIDKVESDPHI